MDADAESVMSAVETRQMPAAETGQMSAVETRQMSAETTQMPSAETREMSAGTIGGCPVSLFHICLFSAEDIFVVSTADI